jgi:preprotein translocase subunit YajC
MLDWIISSAYAEGTAKAAAQPNALMSMAPFILIFVVFYFLMIKPQQKKLKQEQEMVNSLQKGDEIYTKSGLIGTVVGLTDKVMTLEVAEGTKIKVLRQSLGGKASALFEEKK